MRSANVSVKFPQTLKDQLPDLVKACGAKNTNAMIVGLVRYALLHGREHTLTNAIADLSEEAQDQVDQGIIEKFKSGESLHGTYFEHIVDNSVERIANGKDIPKDKIVSEIIQQLRNSGERVG